MTKRYYSTRKKPGALTLDGLYLKLQYLYLLFKSNDYFREKAKISHDDKNLPDAIKHEAGLSLDFQPFPITKWEPSLITEDHIFDTLEFLFDWVSKPGEMEDKVSETNFNYRDYGNYDEGAGREEFQSKVNGILKEYKAGYELTKDGRILALGTDGLEHILDAEIIPYDEANVDSRVRSAIEKWRNRRLSVTEKRAAIRELAEVFEWLQKTHKLKKVLASKDESDLFHIANEFGIRHHNPKQKSNYDKNIWYAWMFHFYLATYHTTIRLLKKVPPAA